MKHASLRLRRLLAWTIDTGPLLGGPLLALPVALTLALLRQEAAAGIGIFDPATGADPARAGALALLDRAAGLLAALGAWAGIELVLIALAGATLGQIAAGLRLAGPDGALAPRGRQLLRYLLRALLLAAPLLTCALWARTPALRGGASDGLLLALLLAQLAAAVADHAAAALALLRDGAGRTWRDRLLGTTPRPGAALDPAGA